MDRGDVMRPPGGVGVGARGSGRAGQASSSIGYPVIGREDGGGWGSEAGDWAEIQEASLRPLFVEVLDRSIELVRPAAALDVACGTGLFCILAHTRGIPRIAG